MWNDLGEGELGPLGIKDIKKVKTSELIKYGND